MYCRTEVGDPEYVYLQYAQSSRGLLTTSRNNTAPSHDIITTSKIQWRRMTFTPRLSYDINLKRGRIHDSWIKAMNDSWFAMRWPMNPVWISTFHDSTRNVLRLIKPQDWKVTWGCGTGSNIEERSTFWVRLGIKKPPKKITFEIQSLGGGSRIIMYYEYTIIIRWCAKVVENRWRIDVLYVQKHTWVGFETFHHMTKNDLVTHLGWHGVELVRLLHWYRLIFVEVTNTVTPEHDSC